MMAKLPYKLHLQDINLYQGLFLFLLYFCKDSKFCIQHCQTTDLVIKINKFHSCNIKVHVYTSVCLGLKSVGESLACYSIGRENGW